MAYLSEEELQNMVQNTYAREKVSEDLIYSIISYLSDTIMEKYDKEIAKRKLMRLLPTMKEDQFEKMYEDFRNRIGVPEENDE